MHSLRTSTLNGKSMALHSINALTNKHTSLSSRPGNVPAPFLLQLLSSIVNLVTGRHGDECILVATKPTASPGEHPFNGPGTAKVI